MHEDDPVDWYWFCVFFIFVIAMIVYGTGGV